MRRMRLTATMSALLLLTACGGDGSEEASAPPAVEADGDTTGDATQTDTSEPDAGEADDAEADDADAGDSGTDAEDEAARIIGEAVSGDREGRAFDADDEMIITTVLAATAAVEAEWDGDTVVATFDDGSVDDIVSGVPCSAIGAIIAADESVLLIYPDGEIDCETWR